MEALPTRYALALVKIAQEEQQLSPYLTCCITLLEMLEKDQTMIQFLSNEFYLREQKEIFIDQIFSSSTWLKVPDFLKVLLRKGRIRYLLNVLKETIQLLRNLLAQQEGIIYSVNPLSQAQLSQLTDTLKAYLGYPVTLTNQIDLTLLGGFKIDIQGKVFDASMIHRLQSLKQQLMKRG